MKNGLWMVLLCLAFLLSCSREGDDAGVVARVNDRPIFLSQLEYRHDLQQTGGMAGQTPAVESLKRDYGRILGDLIVIELVKQELEDRDAAVTPEELAEAEKKVREEYPEGVFEKILVEEYIDLGYWRDQLGNALALEKFSSRVLRPSVKIDYQEAEDYFANHQDRFRLPARVRLFIVNGPERESVEKTLADFKGSDPAAYATASHAAQVRELTVSDEQLPDAWRAMLARLAVGQPGPVHKDEAGFMGLILLEKLPASVMTPAQAYPVIELELLEQKLQAAFDGWLKERMAKAEIRVSAHLLPRPGDADAQGRPVGAPMESLDAQDSQPEQVAGEGMEEPSEELDQGDIEEETGSPESAVKPQHESSRVANPGQRE